MSYSRRVFIRVSIILELSLLIGLFIYGLFHSHKTVEVYGPHLAEAVVSDLLQEEDTIDDEHLVIGGKGGPYKISPALRLCTYKVKNGESLYTIAKKNQLNLEAVLTVNNLKQANAVSIGQKINLPNQRGIMHTVCGGESLEDIALTYNVSIRNIIRVNRVLDPLEIKKGTNLFVPGAKITLAMSREIYKSSGIGGEDFVWPCRTGARISSGFGNRADPFTRLRAFHYGLDLSPGYGASVYATKSGMVTYAGWMGGYGNLIVIQHSNGYSTRYGHLSSILVKKGQRVQQSHTIGRVGSTGRSTGPHLHFEIRENGKALNPRKFLGR